MRFRASSVGRQRCIDTFAKLWAVFMTIPLFAVPTGRFRNIQWDSKRMLLDVGVVCVMTRLFNMKMFTGQVRHHNSTVCYCGCLLVGQYCPWRTSDYWVVFAMFPSWLCGSMDSNMGWWSGVSRTSIINFTTRYHKLYCTAREYILLDNAYTNWLSHAYIPLLLYTFSHTTLLSRQRTVKWCITREWPWQCYNARRAEPPAMICRPQRPGVTHLTLDRGN